MVLETIGYIFRILFSAFIAFLLLAPLIRMIMGALSSTKTVTAVVEKKYVVQVFSKYAGNGVREKYMIAFSVDGKTKRFQVSQFSYNGYQVNEKGMLTYKGNQLIKFE